MEESKVTLVGPGPHWLSVIQNAHAKENGDHVVLTLSFLDDAGRELQSIQAQIGTRAADGLLQELATAVAKVASKTK